MAKFCFTFTILFCFVFSAADCEAKQEHLIQGRTMGTTYQVKVVTSSFGGISGVKEKIDKRLEEINRSMSTYQKGSEISRFNRFKEVGPQFIISNDFFQVMRAGQNLHRLSGGAWDGTVKPLVDLWGFGRRGRQDKVPPNSEIAALLPDIGFTNIDVVNPGFLVKKRAAVTVDLSSIAKGYGVDEVAALLRNLGYKDYLVEIGGEIFAAGHRQDGTRWRIGINRPRADAAFDEVYKVVEMVNQAFATSGDYRNFFEVDGIRYSHIIDPRSGYPVSNSVAGVSIVADTCTVADGLATAIMVMGHESGLELINSLESIEGLIVVAGPDGSLVDYPSKGFVGED
jgi:thiamine biosynthesis lipoprotein